MDQATENGVDPRFDFHPGFPRDSPQQRQPEKRQPEDKQPGKKQPVSINPAHDRSPPSPRPTKRPCLAYPDLSNHPGYHQDLARHNLHQAVDLGVKLGKSLIQHNPYQSVLSRGWEHGFEEEINRQFQQSHQHEKERQQQAQSMNRENNTTVINNKYGELLLDRDRQILDKNGKIVELGRQLIDKDRVILEKDRLIFDQERKVRHMEGKFMENLNMEVQKRGR